MSDTDEGLTPDEKGYGHKGGLVKDPVVAIVDAKNEQIASLTKERDDARAARERLVSQTHDAIAAVHAELDAALADAKALRGHAQALLVLLGKRGHRAPLHDVTEDAIDALRVVLEAGGR